MTAAVDDENEEDPDLVIRAEVNAIAAAVSTGLWREGTSPENRRGLYAYRGLRE